MYTWPNGARAAISLTYDDGLPEHLDAVPQALERNGLRGTFYVPGNSQPLHERPEAFRAVAAAGHELGNHSLFHPCRKDCPGMDWVPDAYDLARYDARRIGDELRTHNLLLHLIDGRRQRSYGATCCHTTIGDGVDMLPQIGGLFTAIRGAGGGGCWLPGTGSPLVLPCTSGDGLGAEELLGLVAQAVAVGGWLVLMFHGVGDAHHRLHVKPEAHAEFLQRLAAREDVYVAPVTTIAETLAD